MTSHSRRVTGDTGPSDDWTIQEGGPLSEVGLRNPVGAASGFPPSVLALPSSSQASLPGSLGKAVWAGSQIAKVARASDILLTRSVKGSDRAWRAGSGLEVASEMSPNPASLPSLGFADVLRHPTRCSLLSRTP